MEAFLAIQPAAGEEGSFRFVLAGPDKIKVRFPITQLLPDSHFEGMIAETELVVGDQIKLEKNSVCSSWIDLVDLVRSQDVNITDEKDEDRSEDFLGALDNYRKDLMEKKGRVELAGISLRWLLGTMTGSTDVLLIAQALPCTLEHIAANPALKTDHTRGVMVGKYTVFYDHFDNTRAAGK